MRYVMPRPTYTQKRRWEPLIIKQTGNYCLFCKRSDIPLEYGHLNSKKNDSRPENIAKMCHPCNCKMEDDFDMRIFAQEQLEKNEDAVLACAGMNKSVGTTEQLTSCQAISANNFKIAEQYVLEHTVTDGYLVVKDGVNDVVGICRKNDNTGSESAVYRYFHTLCSAAFGYEFASMNGVDIMRRGTEN